MLILFLNPRLRFGVKEHSDSELPPLSPSAEHKIPNLHTFRALPSGRRVAGLLRHPWKSALRQHPAPRASGPGQAGAARRERGGPRLSLPECGRLPLGRVPGGTQLVLAGNQSPGRDRLSGRLQRGDRESRPETPVRAPPAPPPGATRVCGAAAVRERPGLRDRAPGSWDGAGPPLHAWSPPGWKHRRPCPAPRGQTPGPPRPRATHS